VGRATRDLAELNLRARTDLVSHALLADLPEGGYPRAAAIFRRALEQPEFNGWMIWPVTETAVTLALASNRPNDFKDCLGLLAELTPRLTSEFALRRLLERDLHTALTVITTWTTSPNEHIRRLASEGTRSHLPWAVRVSALLSDPRATVPHP
jgi:hypothetical protein